MISSNAWRSLLLSLSLSAKTSILGKIKEAYLLWLLVAVHIPRFARQLIGARIENKFLDLLESSYVAYFSPKEIKAQKITECIILLDTLKFLIAIAWEAKFISHKQYGQLAVMLGEIGRMFGGWKNNAAST
jgi:hypothetical protein